MQTCNDVVMQLYMCVCGCNDERLACADGADVQRSGDAVMRRLWRWRKYGSDAAWTKRCKTCCPAAVMHTVRRGCNAAKHVARVQYGNVYDADAMRQRMMRVCSACCGYDRMQSFA